MLDGTSIIPVEADVEATSASDVVLHYHSHFRYNGVLTTRECAQAVGESDSYTDDLNLVNCSLCLNVQARRRREDIERQRVIDSIRRKGSDVKEIF